MKKVIIFSAILIFIVSVFPAVRTQAGSISGPGGSVSLTTGGSTTVSVTGNNVAGSVSVSSSNPSVASASISSNWIENQTLSISIYGASAGSAVITVSYSVADFDDDTKLYQGAYTVSVNVSAPAPAASSSSGSSDYYSEPEPERPQVILSDNNSVSEFSVEGFELEKVNDDYYILVVPNDIDTINVNAIANDSAAKVSGAGERSLTVGENYIDVTVTAENGSQKLYTIYTWRISGIGYLSSLEEDLKNAPGSQICIQLFDDEKLSKENIDMIKNAGKSAIIYRYNYDNQIMTIVGEYILTEDGGLWIETQGDGSTFTLDNDDVSVLSEKLLTGSEETKDADDVEPEPVPAAVNDQLISPNEELIAPKDSSTGEFNVFIIISAVLGCAVIAMLLYYFLRLKKQVTTTEGKADENK